jgi:hypothetical protein
MRGQPLPARHTTQSLTLTDRGSFRDDFDQTFMSLARMGGGMEPRDGDEKAEGGRSYVWKNGAWREIREASVMRNGAWRRIRKAWVMKNGAWRRIQLPGTDAG